LDIPPPPSPFTLSAVLSKYYRMNRVNMARYRSTSNHAHFEILELNVQDPIIFQKGKKIEDNENTDKIMLIVPR
jgi:hypothetical protein